MSKSILDAIQHIKKYLGKILSRRARAQYYYKNEGRTTERYVAVPCAGPKGQGRSKYRHVYSIGDCSGDERVGIEFMTLVEAKDKYGKDLFVSSGTVTLCADCINTISNEASKEVPSQHVGNKIADSIISGGN